MAEIIQEKMSIYEKLQILTDAAKYDVACTSSGVERKGDGTGIGIAARRESVTAFLRMEGVFHF